jgi:hypothetical protein
MVSAQTTAQAGLMIRVRLENHGRRAQRSTLARAFIEAGGRQLWPHNPDALQVMVPPGQDLDLDLDFDLPPTLEQARFVISEAASGTPTPGVVVIGDESSPFHPLAGWALRGVVTKG